MSREIVSVQVGDEILDLEVDAGTSDAEIQAFVAQQQQGLPAPAAPVAQQQQGLPAPAAPVAPSANTPLANAPLANAPPADASPVHAMSQNELEFEVGQRLRRGESPDSIRQFVSTVVDKETGGRFNLLDSPELKAAADYYRRGGNAPFRLEWKTLGPDGTPSTPLGSFARGVGDTLSLNFLDELEAFVETGSFTGPEFEEAWNRRQQRRRADDPDMQAAGNVVGMALGAVLPGGAASRVAGLARQALVGAGVGGGMGALSGVGGAGPDSRFENVGTDALFGAAIGAVAPSVAATGRRVAQTLGFLPQSGADDAIRESEIDPVKLRRLADEFFRIRGRGASIAELLEPNQARAFTAPLSRSPDAQNRVLNELTAARATLPRELSQAASPPSTAGSNALTLGGSTPRRMAGPEELRRKAQDLGDVEIGAIRDVELQLDSGIRQSLVEDVLPFVNLPRLAKKRIENALDSGAPLTVGDFDTIRRALSKSPQVPGARDYADLQDEIRQYVSNQVPEYGEALTNMARRFSVADGGDPRYAGGAELGRQVFNRNVVDFEDAIARQSPEGRLGVELGARSAIVDKAMSEPSQSYRLARDLELDPGLRERLRQALPPGQADELMAFASTQKRAIDAIAALARIPTDKIETILDSTEEMTDTIVSASLGAGGAFKAGLVNGILARTNIGRGAADKLADDLLNPERRERAISLLEKAGLPRLGLREIVQGAFISTGIALTVGARSAEETPATVKTLEIGVPEQ